MRRWISRAGDREVVVLHYFQDLSYAEMAAVLGANEAAVRQRVSRALERLGRALRERGLAADGPGGALRGGRGAEHACRARRPRKGGAGHGGRRRHGRGAHDFSLRA